MAYTRVAAVTGANKGIGFAIVRNLALQYPTSPLNNGGPLLIYLTARDRSRGEQALSDLKTDPQLTAAKALRQHGGLTDVKYAPLDVADEASRKGFEEFLRSEHPEGIDVLVNNAGIALSGFDADIVTQTLALNYHGTLSLTTALLPSIRAPHGRVVTLSSMIGKLNKYPPSITAAFRAAGSPDDVTSLMDAFEAAVRAGSWKAEGWPGSAYAVSKCGIAGAMMALGRVERGRGVLVNVCCPGYVRTDMTKGGGRKSPDQGAKTPVKLALGDVGGVGGEFWEHEEVSQW